MPPDQRSDDPPDIGESVGQFGFREMDLRDMALSLSDATCAIYGLGPGACRMDDWVLAEGVETVAQRDFLFEHGCDAYQGYLCAQELPADAAVSVICKP
jgi:hypothetical protein